MAQARIAVPLSLDLSVPAEPEEVRRVLSRVRAGLDACGTLPDATGRVELVLAEVLNNVVEHAYAGLHGSIALHLVQGVDALSCRVADSGRPMPGGQLPAGRLQPHDVDELPEGGFGWHLIRSLSRDLTYARTDGQNVLTFSIPLFADDA